MDLLRYIYVDIFLTARRASPARRRGENAQAARRGAEQVPVDAVGAPRHAAHRTRIIRPTCLGSCDVVLFCALAFQQFFLSLCGLGLYLRREDYMHGWVHVGMVLRISIRHYWLFSEGVTTSCRWVVIVSVIHILIRHRYSERYYLCIARHVWLCKLLSSVIGHSNERYHHFRAPNGSAG
jgi:hypothetical protein